MENRKHFRWDFTVDIIGSSSDFSGGDRPGGQKNYGRTGIYRE